MAEIVTCSGCQKKLQIPEQYIGQKVQCPECGHMFIAVSTSVSSAPIPPAAASSAAPPRSSDRSRRDDDYDEPPPRRRNRFGDDLDDDDDDYNIGRSARVGRYLQPHRGGLIMALGLISLIGGWLICLPVVVGPVAWTMAQMDLRAIRDGHMDPAGESMVRTGQVCGIISTVILVLAIGGIGCLVLFS